MSIPGEALYSSLCGMRKGMPLYFVLKLSKGW